MSLFKRRSDRGRVEPAPHPSDEWEEMAVRLDARGCSPEEITSVESDQGIPLPPNYRRFLELMGRDGGGLVGGKRSVLSGDARPEDAVVFMMHQGYQFMYLRGSRPKGALVD